MNSMMNYAECLCSMNYAEWMMNAELDDELD